jgi:hypothetical protein
MKKFHFLMLLLACMILAGCNGDADGLENAKSSLFIPFVSNGYVTPLDPTSKESPSFANEIILNHGPNMINDGEMIPNGWQKKFVEAEPHQLSVFFYTAYTGTIDLDLVVRYAYSDATLCVEIDGTEHNVFVEQFKDGYYNEKICNVGKFKISKPGYVRINITAVDSKTIYYPSLWGFQVRGAGIGNVTGQTEKVMFVSEDNMPKITGNASPAYIATPFWIRRGPYLVFWWDQPADTEYFYNEVYVAEGDDINGAYYAVVGGDKFYMGIQPQKKGNGRCVLFSVWDTNTATGDVSELVNKNEAVWSNNFGNEGSGIQNFYYHDWEAGHTYAVLVRVRPEVVDGVPTGHSLYTGYFRGDEGWVFIAEVRRPNIQTYLTNPYSFNENYLPEQGWVPKSVSFPSQWARDKDGNWHEIVDCRFTATPNNSARKISRVRYDYKAGVNEQGDFYLTAGGYFNDGRTTEHTRFTRKPSGTAPNIDLAALEQMAKKR